MFGVSTAGRTRPLETKQVGLIELWRDSRHRRFERDVLEGLSARPKAIPSHHLFDDHGAKLTRAFLKAPEYYLSRVERDILVRDGRALVGPLDADTWDVIDLAPGDGLKTRILLERLRGSDVRYVPIAGSSSLLHEASEEISHALRWLPMFPVRAEGFAAIAHLGALDTSRRRIVLLLGSQIGQFERPAALTFLRGLHDVLRPGDRLLISFDLLKDPEILEQAYGDREGLHAQLCFNILGRMNRELSAEFPPAEFDYRVRFCPLRQAVISELVSKRAQAVRVGHFCHEFAPGEAIQTQLACKYRQSEIEALARRAGFTQDVIAMDERTYMQAAAWSVPQPI